MMKDPVIRYIALNALVGKVIGWAIVAAILVFDGLALWSLKTATDVTGLAAVMLMFVAGTSLGMIQMGVAIMAMGSEGQKSPLGRLFGRLAVGRPQAS
jgi:hypothetical protein